MKTNTHKIIGEMIRKQRQKQGMTQLELSLKLGYESMQFVSLIERGLSKTPYKIIGQLGYLIELDIKKCMKLLKQDFESNVLNEIQSGLKIIHDKEKQLNDKN